MSNSKEEILKTQLCEVNQRSRMYAQRFWQLPFAYLGVVGIALAAASEGDPKHIRLGAIALCIMGILVFWIMIGTFRAIDRSVGVIQQMEKKLGLQISVKKHHWMIDIPNFLLVIVGIVICGIAVALM